LYLGRKNTNNWIKEEKCIICNELKQSWERITKSWKSEEVKWRKGEEKYELGLKTLGKLKGHSRPGQSLRRGITVDEVDGQHDSK
jgi:hypothetical protein